MIDLIGKVVDVMANDIVYTGTLIEIGEGEVYLETDMGSVVIPVEQIAFIREKEAE